jgi:hypothetical protein
VSRGAAPAPGAAPLFDFSRIQVPANLAAGDVMFSISNIRYHISLLGIRFCRNRIRMVFGIQDPDPLVRGIDPDLNPTPF